MCRVLINQDEAIRIFHQNIQFAKHTDDLELLLSSSAGLLLWGKRLACRISARLWQARKLSGLPYNFRSWCPAGVNDSGYSRTKMW
jgi:hypothetical protein